MLMGTVLFMLIPSSLTATNPLSISNNIISLGGLTNFGSSGQVITSTGTGLTYSDTK